jgi:hypothetical protein
VRKIGLHFIVCPWSPIIHSACTLAFLQDAHVKHDLCHGTPHAMTYMYRCRWAVSSITIECQTIADWAVIHVCNGALNKTCSTAKTLLSQRGHFGAEGNEPRFMVNSKNRFLPRMIWIWMGHLAQATGAASAHHRLHQCICSRLQLSPPALWGRHQRSNTCNSTF